MFRKFFGDTIGGALERVASEVTHYSEEDNLKIFLEKSKNYQELKKIQTTSESSKQGLLGNLSFARTWSQVDDDDARRIADIQAATSFAELLRNMDVHFNAEGDAIKNVTGFARHGWQKANAEFYLIELAKEASKYAAELQYDFAQEYNYYKFSNG